MSFFFFTPSAPLQGPVTTPFFEKISLASDLLAPLVTAGPAIGAKGGTELVGSGGTVPFWQDTAFWVLVPFVIVVYILVSRGVPKLIGGALDTKSREIRDELEVARALKEEAQELLANAQRQQNDAEAEAAAIIAQAREDAKRFSEEIRVRMEEQLSRRAKAAEQKIARAEAQAISDIRHQTIEFATAAAGEVIAQRLDKDRHARLIDSAISRLGSIAPDV